jgi:hypothetical protein
MLRNCGKLPAKTGHPGTIHQRNSSLFKSRQMAEFTAKIMKLFWVFAVESNHSRRSTNVAGHFDGILDW